jgi:hypothetical protein
MEEFNFRHDWNSLIESHGLEVEGHDTAGPRPAPFTEWTEEYWPSADILTQYIREFAKRQEPFIHYSTEVLAIEKKKTTNGFNIRVKKIAFAQESVIACTVVIAAPGFHKAHTPEWMNNLAKYTIGYEELTPLKDFMPQFVNKSVLILGNGNSAFEVADAVRNVASDIGILGRSGETLAAHSHYVGDVRGKRTTTLDSLNLKSLDDAFVISPQAGKNLHMLPCGDTIPNDWETILGWDRSDSQKLQKAVRERPSTGFNGSSATCIFEQVESKNERMLLLADYDTSHPAVKAALQLFGADLKARPLGPRHIQWHSVFVESFGTELQTAAPGVEAIEDAQVLAIQADRALELAKTSHVFRALLPLLSETTEGLSWNHDRIRKPYDVVVRALGWRLDRKMMFDSLDVAFDLDDKYPELSSCYESSEPGLYFAGTVSHGVDKKRYGSAGGFIHGFRYTSRALVRCLVERFENRRFWAGGRTTFEWNLAENTSTMQEYQHAMSTKNTWLRPYALRDEIERRPLWERLFRRINEASVSDDAPTTNCEIIC